MPDSLYNLIDGVHYSLARLAVLTGFPLSSWQHWTRMKQIAYFKKGYKGTKYILGSVVKTFLRKNTVGELSNV